MTRNDVPLYLSRTKLTLKSQIVSLDYFLDCLKNNILLSACLIIIQVFYTALFLLKNESSTEEVRTIRIEGIRIAFLT